MDIRIMLRKNLIGDQTESQEFEDFSKSLWLTGVSRKLRYLKHSNGCSVFYHRWLFLWWKPGDCLDPMHKDELVTPSPSTTSPYFFGRKTKAIEKVNDVFRCAHFKRVSTDPVYYILVWTHTSWLTFITPRVKRLYSQKVFYGDRSPKPKKKYPYEKRF